MARPLGDGIEGFAELERALKELSVVKQRRAIRNAARASLLPVEKSAKQLVPKGTRPHKTYKGRLVGPGFASRNINRSSGMSKDGATFFATVGTKKEGFYVRQFIEGVVDAPQKPQPWLRPAYEVNRGKVKKLFAQKLREQIIKQAKKAK